MEMQEALLNLKDLESIYYIDMVMVIDATMDSPFINNIKFWQDLIIQTDSMISQCMKQYGRQSRIRLKLYIFVITISTVSTRQVNRRLLKFQMIGIKYSSLLIHSELLVGAMSLNRVWKRCGLLLCMLVVRNTNSIGALLHYLRMHRHIR